MGDAIGRIEVVYRGRVQGVGFRASVSSLARPLQVTGWVMNEPDGAVRMQAQGERGEVERLVVLIEERMGSFIRDAMRGDVPVETGERRFDIRV